MRQEYIHVGQTYIIDRWGDPLVRILERIAPGYWRVEGVLDNEWWPRGRVTGIRSHDIAALMTVEEYQRWLAEDQEENRLEAILNGPDVPSCIQNWRDYMAQTA